MGATLHRRVVFDGASQCRTPGRARSGRIAVRSLTCDGSTTASLRLGGGNQRARGLPQEGNGFTRSEYLRTDKGAIDEQGELTGELVRVANAQPFGDSFQRMPQFSLVGRRDLACGMVGFGKLRCNVDLRAAAIVRPPNPLTDPPQMGVQ